jgi:hypothetical protein
MPTLRYWLARVKDDHPCEHRHDRTRKALLRQLENLHGLTGWRDFYEAPMRVLVEHANALDLVVQCLQEGGAFWEEPPPECSGVIFEEAEDEA